MSSVVNIGNVPLGGDNPIRIQSMTNTSTMDTEGSIEQCIRIIEAGADYVRLTAQGVREAENLRNIRDGLRAHGYTTPLIADIHFNPAAAFAAAEIVEKVRINPGNFVDSPRQFKHLEYSDEEYAEEINKIRERFAPFLDVCKKHHTAIRIGVNHGSLSDRIMSRFGNTSEGMVESCMEYLKICVEEGFTDVVISMKASNPKVMIDSVRLLSRRMKAEGMDFPLHIGVTEAGDGEDGRIKSAVGIGTLLREGLGDTIRVSLSEPPEAEIPVAKALVEYCHWLPPNVVSREGGSGCHSREGGDDITPIVIANKMPTSGLMPDMLYEEYKTMSNPPAIIHRVYDETDVNLFRLKAATDCGYYFLEGLADGIFLENSNDSISVEEIVSCAFGILQATGARISKTEYIACPSCGRTLFDLQTGLKKVKEATSHLKGLKIAVMGCIVNGPGEMADADYGYVGAGKGKVSLYKGKTCIKSNIPEEDAIPELLKIISSDFR